MSSRGLSRKNRNRLPEDVGSVAELVRRYLNADSSLGTGEICRRLKADYGIDATYQTVASPRQRFLDGLPSKPKGKYKLPEGVQSMAELVRRYLAVDSGLGTAAIRDRLKAEFGIDANYKTVDTPRRKYFSSLGKKPLKTAKLPPFVVSKENIEANGDHAVADGLLGFLKNVRSVGGVKAALNILYVLEDFNG